jgi:hypothetical protein
MTGGDIAERTTAVTIEMKMVCIPVKLKQVITGYDLDPSGNCGKDCKVCKMWNEKFKKDSAACWKEIEEKQKSENW